MPMSEHVKRGATKHTNRDMRTDWEGIDDEGVNSRWFCTECDAHLRIHQRRGLHAYITVECPCGAESLDLRVADIFDFEMETWDTDPIVEGGDADD